MSGNSLVSPAETMDFLGLKFHCKLKSDPHICSLISGCSFACRHCKTPESLPPFSFGCGGCLIGKAGYGVNAEFFTRLSHDYPNPAQARINDVARAILNLSRTNSPSVANLLKQIGLPLVNHLLELVAIEAWKSLGSLCRKNVNWLTSLFGPIITLNTMAGNLGLRKPVKKFLMNTFINTAITLWNGNHGLRSTQMLGTAAKAMAVACPPLFIVLVSV